MNDKYKKLAEALIYYKSGLKTKNSIVNYSASTSYRYDILDLNCDDKGELINEDSELIKILHKFTWYKNEIYYSINVEHKKREELGWSKKRAEEYNIKIAKEILKYEHE